MIKKILKYFGYTKTEYVLVYENMFLKPPPDKNPFEPAKNLDGSWYGEPGALWMIEDDCLIRITDRETDNIVKYFRLEKQWIDYIREATDSNNVPVYNECPAKNGCYCTGYCHRVAYYKDKV